MFFVWSLLFFGFWMTETGGALTVGLGNLSSGEKKAILCLMIFMLIFPTLSFLCKPPDQSKTEQRLLNFCPYCSLYSPAVASLPRLRDRRRVHQHGKKMPFYLTPFKNTSTLILNKKTISLNFYIEIQAWINPEKSWNSL